MDFGLSEEQELLQETITRFFDEKCPIKRVREFAEPAGPAAGEASALWQEVASLGVAGILVPAEHGGAGLALLDTAVAAQALGECVAPVPFLGTSVMAPVALLEGGDDVTQARWLPGIASGECTFGVAATEWVASRSRAALRVDGERISGRALMALDAGAPDAWLIAVPGDSPRLALVEGGAAGLELEAFETIDRTRSFGALTLDSVAASAWLAEPDRVIPRMLSAGRVALAADLLGASDRALALALAYAKERVQFERVIASFQAVKHLCAEMAAEIEPARSLLWYAAHAFDEVPEEAFEMACHAKAHLSEVGTFVARTATEVHGGIGFTDEQNLHFWFKRIGVDRQLLGGPYILREAAARQQGWVAGS